MRAARTIAKGAPVLLGLFMLAACGENKVPLAESSDEAADFGRGALMDAVVLRSKSPTDIGAHVKFARTVEELDPIFSRKTRNEAKMRLWVSAVQVMYEHRAESPRQQMQRFATTVWPEILEFPSEEGESADEYIERLCDSELMVECGRLVPEYWPKIFRARVWRILKSSIAVGYARCQSCQEDPTHAEILRIAKQEQERAEVSWDRTRALGEIKAWPRAGPNAQEPSDETTILRFRSDGNVTVNGRIVADGNWRSKLEELQPQVLTVHLRPERLVADLEEILAEIRRIGVSRASLAVRWARFPHALAEYSLSEYPKGFSGLGVRNSDTIQILVQALDHDQSRAQGANENEAGHQNDR